MLEIQPNRANGLHQVIESPGNSCEHSPHKEGNPLTGNQPTTPGSQHSASLWTLLPLRIRWSVLPIFTTAVLVGAGPELAESLFDRKFDNAPLLLLLNLVLALWVFQHVIELEIAEAGEIPDIPARLLSFAALFVTVADLFKYMVAGDLDEYVAVFGLAALFYFLVVPFTLYRVPADKLRHTSNSKVLLSFLQLSTRSAFGAALIVASIALFDGLFFIILNDGISIGSFNSAKPVQAFFNNSHRVEFWVVNPMLLSIPAMFVYLLRVGKPMGPSLANFNCGLTRSGKGVLIGSFTGLIALMSLVMLNADDLHGGDLALTDFADRTAVTAALKLTVGYSYAGSFLSAVWILHASADALSRKRLRTYLAFATFGALAGTVLVCVRWFASAEFRIEHIALIPLHAIAFMLAASGYSIAIATLSRSAGASGPPEKSVLMDAPTIVLIMSITAAGAMALGA